MASMDATFYADCEIIIKTFEKSAAFSSDPRSVYALSTTLISKGGANAANVEKQIDFQLENSERTKSKRSGRNEPTNTESNASDREEDQYDSSTETESAQKDSNASKSSTPATDWWNNIGQEDPGGWQLEDCIPCSGRINGAELAVQGIGDELKQWSEIIEENLKGVVNQMLALLDMFKDQGRSVLKGLCNFWNMLKLIKCPSDIMRIIAALTAALTKLSVDIFGELGMMLNLAKAILTPILSALVQLVKNFLQAIIAPVHCIIDALQKQLLEAPADWMEALSSGAGGFKLDFAAKSTFADQDWSLTEKDPPRTPDNSALSSIPVVAGAIPATNSLSGSHPPQVSSREIWRGSQKLELRKNPGEERGITHKEFTKLGSEIEALAKAGKTETQEFRQKKKKYNESGLNQTIKGIRDFNNSIDKAQTQFNTIFEATLYHLQSIARYLEDLVEAWIGELAKLVGGALTIEFGFAQKGVQKLGLLTLIATCNSLLKFANKAGKERCTNEEVESAIQDAFSDSMGWLLKKEEDGSLSIFTQNTGLGSEDTDQFELDETGDSDMDSYTGRATQAITAPPPTVSFSCLNAVSQDADANQINEWIAQLDEAKI
jgi:hypothetical protein